MSRVYNISAGPAVLPEEVLERGCRRNADYNWNRNVSYGDEPQVESDLRRSLIRQNRI